jgi:membrane-associated phospholipid phosphatase
MPPHSPLHPSGAFDEQLFDGVNGFARHTTWLHSTMTALSDYGILACVALLILAAFLARRRPAAAMAAVITGFIAAPAASLANTLIKDMVAEQRPCRSIPHALILETCPPPTDFAFPSNHVAIATATAMTLLVIDRRLALAGLVLTTALSLSRVYVGAHYPHDAAAGAILGAAASYALTHLGVRTLTPSVTRLRRSRLAFLAGPGIEEEARPVPVSHIV